VRARDDIKGVNKVGLGLGLGAYRELLARRVDDQSTHAKTFTTNSDVKKHTK
jgi:hypothetical protein